MSVNDLFHIKSKSVTTTLSVESLRFSQIYFLAICLFYEMQICSETDYLPSIWFILNALSYKQILIFSLFSLKFPCFCTFSSKSSKWFFKWSECFYKTIRMFRTNHTNESGKSFRWFGRTDGNKEKKYRKKPSWSHLKTILTPRKLHRTGHLGLTLWQESIFPADTLIHFFCTIPVSQWQKRNFPMIPQTKRQ